MRLTIARRREMLQRLEKTYHGATTGLIFASSFELLIAVVLSAQCTDTRVNIITRRLFPEWNSPEKMLDLGVERLEELIHDCGLFRAKAKNIMKTCHMLVEEYSGEVPGTMENLIKLPGVGRKTANVMLSHQFGIPAIAVDTHVFRVSNRTGLAQGKTPDEVEQGLMKLIPRSQWSDSHHWLIWHGRKICRARNPLCGQCCIGDLCPSSTITIGENPAGAL
ncbi:MAG TPA: endonuclease III [Negativicutes bacterium]|nr:endonuclease III [Negativicutes bacterium]